MYKKIINLGKIFTTVFPCGLVIYLSMVDHIYSEQLDNVHNIFNKRTSLVFNVDQTYVNIEFKLD